MGFFSKIFSDSNKQNIKLLEATITQLRVGIFSRLSKKYIPVYGKQNGEFLSVAILNEALIENPTNEEAENYCRNNKLLINEEVLQLSFDPVISEAFSYLYAAQTLLLVFLTREPFSKRSQELGEQASRLGIYIPNTFDICGSDNAQECIFAIMEYSTKYLKKNE